MAGPLGKLLADMLLLFLFRLAKQFARRRIR
jgi:hypothetical protein